jgi:tRNA (adenine57-N1/adenine58-N1)-methyltransferase catalytic subunit
VCQNGFDENLNGLADAVFLDLPAPHLAVPAALKALKKSGKYFIGNQLKLAFVQCILC